VFSVSSILSPESLFDILTRRRAISHDPDVYPNPEEFIPERFLDEVGQLTGEEEDTVFGYGRR
jgi:cytochrome P450